MKTILAILLLSVLGDTEPVPASMCIGLPPLCSFGTAPLCICSSPYDYTTCQWACVGR